MLTKFLSEIQSMFTLRRGHPLQQPAAEADSGNLQRSSHRHEATRKQPVRQPV